MRILTPVQALGAAAALALLAGCSNGGSSAISPVPASPQGAARPTTQRTLHFLNPNGRLTRHRFVSHYSCPAKGFITYVSDQNNGVINVYARKFAGQSPCGHLASRLLNSPQALFVSPASHDLYVANLGNHNVLVFHRGRTNPYNTYTDPSNQFPVDVAVANDGTVIASNFSQSGGPELGSISTWIGGADGGTFIGNFPMSDDTQGWFVTVKKNGLVYYNDVDASSHHGALWSLSCPAGVCGAQTRLAGVSFAAPGGMAIEATGDLLAIDRAAVTADTFELPNPTPSTFSLTGDPAGMAIDALARHLFIADPDLNDAAEYSYPSGTFIGTVPGNAGGSTVGIAVDT